MFEADVLFNTDQNALIGDHLITIIDSNNVLSDPDFPDQIKADSIQDIFIFLTYELKADM